MTEFIDTYLFAYGHSTGPLVGLVSVDRVRAVPAGDRRTTTLRGIAGPLAEVSLGVPDESLTELLPRLDRPADRRALVVDDGRLVGIVRPVDVNRAWSAVVPREQRIEKVRFPVLT